MNPEAVMGLSNALGDPIHVGRWLWSCQCPDCGRWFTCLPSRVSAADRMSRHRLQEHT